MQTAEMAVLVQVVTIVISAVGVIATIIWNRNITRRKTTVDMLFSEQSNDLLLKARSDFVLACLENKFPEITNREHWFKPESFFFISVCNRYEMVAIGIRHNIIDENIYKTYWRKTIVMDWLRAKDAIIALRARLNHPTLFCEFEELALKWTMSTDKADLVRPAKAP